MTLDERTTQGLQETCQRLGYNFLLASTRVTIPELQRALQGQPVRDETHERLTRWAAERLDWVERGTANTEEKRAP